MAPDLPRAAGRSLFAAAAGGDRAARPDYPERVYELLASRCGLGDGCRTLDVGAGAGGVARRLAALGARPVVALEPDPGFAAELAALARASGGAVVPRASALEDAELGEARFDLVVCATVFHWLDPEVAPRQLGASLRPGGWLALFWNVFGDPRRPDPFHEATSALLAGLEASPSHPGGRPLPFALDAEARRADLARAGADAPLLHEEIRWTWTVDPAGVRALYATFSPVARLGAGEREALLNRLAEVAERDFAGRVERPMVTPVYLGRRAAGRARPRPVGYSGSALG